MAILARPHVFSNTKRKSRVGISPKKQHKIESKLNAGVSIAIIAANELLSNWKIYNIRNAIQVYPDAEPRSLITDGWRCPDSPDLEAAINQILS